MYYLLIRHGKTDANRLTRAAFGKAGAPLNEVGQGQARRLRDELLTLGIDLAHEPVAISEFLRTKETAEYAGLQRLEVNSLLNEVKTPDPVRTNAMIAEGTLPPEARLAAQKILKHPPRQKIWITHGLIIAALCAELGQTDSSKMVPDFCEIVRIEF